MDIDKKIVERVEKNKKPIRKWELSDIKNNIMLDYATITRMASTKDEAELMLKQYFTELTNSYKGKFKIDNDYINKVVEILDYIRGIRYDFMQLYDYHMSYYHNFDTVLDHLSITEVTIDVQYAAEEDVLNKHRELVGGIYNTFSEGGKNPNVVDGKYTWMSDFQISK